MSFPHHSRRVICIFTGYLLILAGSLLPGCSDSDGANSAEVCAGVDCGQGVCASNNGEAVCLCPAGYIAEDLACLVDPCIGDACLYGVCGVSSGKAVCRCDQGYTGNRCDRCALGHVSKAGQCVQGDPCGEIRCGFGQCTTGESGPICVCDTGYVGTQCDRCADGYHAEGLLCVGESPCHPSPCVHGDCSEQSEGFFCQCPDGYTSRLCDQCDSGYHTEGELCLKDTVQSGDPCDPNPCTAPRTRCLDNGGVATCNCEEGLSFDGTDCVEYQDPCDPNPCTEALRTVCLRESGTHRCLCDSGYKEEDGQCVKDENPLPVRDCTITLKYQSSSSGPVYVRGEFNAWGSTHPMQRNGSLWEIELHDLPIGEYAYKLYDAATNSWFLDPNNRFTKYVDGALNSLLRVSDCRDPELVLDAEPKVQSGSISFTVSSYLGSTRAALDATLTKVTRNGIPYPADFDATTGVFTVQESNLTSGKYSYLFRVTDKEGRKSRTLFVPLWVETKNFDWRDASLYFVLTDRFKNGDTKNDRPISNSDLTTAANWQGGDFAGIRQKLESGYFEAMGINTLWISSPVLNTSGAFWGSDPHMYSGYHSYWPIATGWTEDKPLTGISDPIDPHFGTLGEFKDLVQIAHEKGMRVLVDFVANHIHLDSPVYKEHMQESQSWFNWNNNTVGQGYVCGWDKPIECWFASYLPDFDYRNGKVMNLVMDHAIWLIQETNVDGFRMDAVKHMILDFSTTLRARLDEDVDTVQGIRFYMVGETFTWKDDGAKVDIKRYLGDDLLDGQFDFPLFWNTVDTFLRHGMSMGDMKNFMDGNDGYYGPGAIMSNFLGNHDVPRAIGHADGTVTSLGDGAKDIAWTEPPSAPQDVWPYKKLRQAWTFLFSQNGVPLIYYGDEVGLPGAGDPDNRRMMIFDAGLSPYQRETLDYVKKLGKARSEHSALRHGSRNTIKVEQHYWAYVMKDANDACLVVLNRGGERQDSLSLGAAGLADGAYTDIISGATLTVTNGTGAVSLGAVESALFVKK